MTGIGAVRLSAQPLQQRRTVHVRHHDVEQDQVRPPSDRRGQRLRAGGAVAHGKEGIAYERRLDGLSRVRLVVDQQDVKADQDVLPKVDLMSIFFAATNAWK
jgi:hypothetical protein